MVYRPYRGLMPYTEEDRPFFFGRDRETEIIASNLITTPLTLLVGASGVGKSSLLNAGVVPYLSGTGTHEDRFERGRLALIRFDAWQQMPLLGIESAIKQQLAHFKLPTLEGTLAQKLRAWSEHCGAQLLIIFDQFEDYFLYHPQGDDTGNFMTEFPEAVNQPGLRATFLVSLREESLAKLDCFKGTIARLFGNYLRLDHLDMAAARAAIRGPLEAFNRIHAAELTVEDELIEEVCREVRRGKVVLGDTGRGSVDATEGRVETPYLQLVMSRIWDEEIRLKSRVLRAVTLQKLGRAENIVRTHTDAVLDACSPTEQLAASRIFHYLVTPSHTKIAHTPADLAVYTGLPEREVTVLLEKLSAGDSRIMCPLQPGHEQGGGVRYHIFHDVLAPSILDWRARYIARQKDNELEAERWRSANQSRMFAALAEIGAAMSEAVELDRHIDIVLAEITDVLGFEFAAISLVDEYRNSIEMVRGRNVPVGWIQRSKYSIDSADIHADCLRTSQSFVLEGPDPRLDFDTFERFEFTRLAHVFVPIMAAKRAIGTIHAGVVRERRPELITQEKVNALEKLAREHGPAIARSRPHVLLELIAEHVMRILDADDASVHVYQNSHLYLQAGAGKAEKTFLARFPPRPVGIGQESMRRNAPVVVDSPADLAAQNPALYDAGVRSTGAWPLSLGMHIKGVVYLRFWREHRFTSLELELAAVFTKQMEVAIRNILLLNTVAAAAQKGWELSNLQTLIQSISSNRNLNEVLDRVATQVLQVCDADSVLLYQYYQEEGRFHLPPVMRGSFRHPEEARNALDPGAVLVEVVRDGRSFFFEEAALDERLAASAHGGPPRFVQREEIRSCAAVPLRSADGEAVGCMLMNYRSHIEFGVEVRRTMEALAASAAIAIKSARQYSRADAEAYARRALDFVVKTNPDSMSSILNAILDQAVAVTNARTGSIFAVDRSGHRLHAVAARGISEAALGELSMDEGAIGHAAKIAQAVLIADTSQAHWRPWLADSRSELAVPILDGETLLGVINLERPDVAAFRENDLTFINTLAVQAAIALRSADLRRRFGQQLEIQRAIGTLANWMMGRRHDVDAGLRAILTGVTAGQGLGFSRAMLLLADETGQSLRGAFAVGALTREEAEETWSALSARAGVSFELLLDLAIDNRSVAIDSGRDYPLTRLIQNVDWPLNASAGAVALAVLHRRSIAVPSEASDPFRSILPGPVTYAFICTPLIDKGGRPLGVLIVDDRFLPTEAVVQIDRIPALETCAALAATLIESRSTGVHPEGGLTPSEHPPQVREL